jgi:hypothetical protein
VRLSIRLGGEYENQEIILFYFIYDLFNNAITSSERIA